MKRTILFIIFGMVLTFLSCKESRKGKTTEIMSSENVVPAEEFILSRLISKNGKIVLEEYYNGKTKDSLCDVQSLTKGLMSILIGVAIDKAYIKHIDEPIENYFPDEFKNLTDKKKSNIKIRHLLNQTSGLSWKGYLEHEAWLNSEDPISFVLNKNLENSPGDKYNYN